MPNPGRRVVYQNSINKLFDIATPGLEDILQQSRLLGNDDECSLYRAETGYTRKVEDVAFLIDQRTERKMTMGLRDPTYEKRLDKSLQKKGEKLTSQAGASKDSSVTANQSSSTTEDAD